jgi:hypothetical protein
MGNNNRLRNGIVALLGFSLAGWPRGLGAAQPPEERISQPGRYQGYSRVRFDGWRRSSRYLTMRDGVRIAIDVLRPTRSNVLHEERLPVIWEHRRYLRAVLNPSGKIYSQLDRQDHPMRKLVQHGYICAVADGRGSGVSFGARIDPNPPQESLAAYDITEWLATQPWCNGRVGMYGISYSGTAQLMAAGTAPPHLKAIFPEMGMFDLLPTGRHFAAGHRIRIAITCADKDSCQTPQLNPAPSLTVFRDAQHPSGVILPGVE